GKALAEVQQMLGVFAGWLGQARSGEPRELYKIGLNSRRFLLAVCDVLVGWLLQRQADVALRALAQPVTPPDRAFYAGKVAVARFFAHEVLPRVGADRRVIEATSLELMDLPEEAF